MHNLLLVAADDGVEAHAAPHSPPTAAVAPPSCSPSRDGHLLPACEGGGAALKKISTPMRRSPPQWVGDTVAALPASGIAGLGGIGTKNLK